MDHLKKIEEAIDELSILALEGAEKKDVDDLLEARRKLSTVCSATLKGEQNNLHLDLLAEAMDIVFQHSVDALEKLSSGRASALSDIYKTIQKFYEATVEETSDVYSQ